MSLVLLVDVEWINDNMTSKDGNGDPIPDTRRVFDPLGDGDGIITLPAGI